MLTRSERRCESGRWGEVKEGDRRVRATGAPRSSIRAASWDGGPHGAQQLNMVAIGESGSGEAALALL
jgi:hypothetical protein